MEAVDWRLVSLAFNVIQFVGMIAVFMIIKFNDLKHIEADVKKLENKCDDMEEKQTNRHLENVNAINDLAIKVSEVHGMLIAQKEK